MVTTSYRLNDYSVSIDFSCKKGRFIVFLLSIVVVGKALGFSVILFLILVPS